MMDTEVNHLERIAFTLVTSRNQKARRRLLKKNIGPGSLPAAPPPNLNPGFADDEIKRH